MPKRNKISYVNQLKKKTDVLKRTNVLDSDISNNKATNLFFSSSMSLNAFMHCQQYTDYKKKIMRYGNYMLWGMLITACNSGYTAAVTIVAAKIARENYNVSVAEAAWGGAVTAIPFAAIATFLACAIMCDRIAGVFLCDPIKPSPEMAGCVFFFAAPVLSIALGHALCTGKAMTSDEILSSAIAGTLVDTAVLSIGLYCSSKFQV